MDNYLNANDNKNCKTKIAAKIDFILIENRNANQFRFHSVPLEVGSGQCAMAASYADYKVQVRESANRGFYFNGERER